MSRYSRVHIGVEGSDDAKAPREGQRTGNVPTEEGTDEGGERDDAIVAHLEEGRREEGGGGGLTGLSDEEHSLFYSTLLLSLASSQNLSTLYSVTDHVQEDGVLIKFKLPPFHSPPPANRVQSLTLTVISTRPNFHLKLVEYSDHLHVKPNS